MAKLPTNLAFTGSLSVTQGLMYGASSNGDRIAPVEVMEQTVRGTLSNASQAKDVEKKGKLENANIQRVDIANLPVGTDHLRVDFNMKVTPALWTPSACNDASYRALFAEYLEVFTEKGGMDKLAKLYAEQIMSDDWLWRNKDGLNVSVTARVRGRQMDPVIATRDVVTGETSGLEDLTGMIAEVLSNQRSLIFIEVTGLVELSEMAEVYPSQEFVDGKEKSKTLFTVNSKDGKSQAAFHSQKIGNALRRIDSWHGHESNRRIAVEMYGVDQGRHDAYRKNGNTFYDFARNIEKLIAVMREEGINDDHLYFTACLIRGGVFGEK